MEKCYNVENLDCAHCGSKIEAEINKIAEVENAVLIFASKKLKVKGNITEDTEKKMQAICDKIENGVKISPYSEKSHEHNHEHESLSIAALIAGVILFAIAIIVHKFTDFNILGIALYIISYLILGHEVLIDTFKSLKSGSVFDENFLMTIATIGAFALGDYSEAVGVVLFFNVGSLFEHYAVNKSRKAISDAIDLKVDEADVLIDNEFKRCKASDIKVDDIVRVKNGEHIAVDGIIVSGTTRIDTSAINGESVPIKVSVGDSVVSGCINTSDVITIKATATAQNSMISKIADAVENAVSSKPGIDRFITKFAKVYTPFVICAAFLTAIVPSLITGNWSYWIYTALTFLVISCPCALVLSIPLTFFSGIGAASKRGILFKGGNSLEALSKIKAVVFDKTGTVTNGTFEVTEIECSNNITKEQLLLAAAMCEEASNHPIAVSIMKYCKKNNIKFNSAESVREISGQGIIAEYENQTVLCGNSKLMQSNNISIAEDKKNVGSIVYIAVNNIYAGKIVISDTLKPSSKDVINKFNKSGIKTGMLTGDRKENADNIAEILGMDFVKSELLPENKLDELKKIRSEYGSVMFVGDGINDGPVIAGADVGFAVQNGSDLAIEAADVVLMNDNLNLAYTAKQIADQTSVISKENIIFALVIKAAVMLLGFMGVANMWFAVFADSGVAMLLVINSIRILGKNKFR